MIILTVTLGLFLHSASVRLLRSTLADSASVRRSTLQLYVCVLCKCSIAYSASVWWRSVLAPRPKLNRETRIIHPRLQSTLNGNQPLDSINSIAIVMRTIFFADTFASKVAAIGDQYADASIGNVTGSNAVNVFLGIGIAWTVAAIYWAVTGRTPEEKKFHVPPSNLAFSVTIFSAFACIAIAILMYRRRSPKIQAELGGPRKSKIVGSCIFFLLWLIYIILSALDSYCIIKTF